MQPKAEEVIIRSRGVPQAEEEMADERVVKVSAKWSYGKNLFYPVNKLAQDLCAFAKCKSITEDQILVLRTLGYRIEAVTPVLPGEGDDDAK